MMNIYDGRESFYQWDLNQKITSTGFKLGEQIHFFNMKQRTALVVDTYELDGKIVANVPNVLLQSSYPITAYRYVSICDGKTTVDEWTFEVTQRAKPDDYIYTETEVYTVKEAIDKAFSEIEQNGYPLIDKATGKTYLLFIKNSKLMIEESED